MSRNATGAHVDARRKLLLETLCGHFALLQTAHPRKANTLTARRARLSVALSLRELKLHNRAA